MHSAKSADTELEEARRGASFAARRALLYRELYHHLTSVPNGYHRPAPASAIDLPRPLARGLVHFYSLLKMETISAADTDLADQVALATARWFAALWDDLQYSAPMEDLLSSRPGTQDPSPERLEELLDQASRLWPGRETEWSELRRLLARADRFQRTDFDLHRRALCRRYVHLRQAALHQQRDLRREQVIRLVATPLADHLNEHIPRLQRHQTRTRELFGTGGSWRVLATDEPEINWTVLTQYRRYLEHAPGLLHLCDLVVRGTESPGLRAPEEVRPKPPAQTVVVDREMDEEYGTVLSDPGLLAFPDTEHLFARKYAAGTLLRSGYHRDRAVRPVQQTPERHASPRRRRRGRITLCVDTSGSMRGTPEEVARAAILGVVRAALLAGRPAAVLVYTDHLEELVLPSHKRDNLKETEIPVRDTKTMAGSSPPVVPEAVLTRLSELLNSTFFEGADIDPTLERALTALEQGDPDTFSDVMIVSDMRFPRIPPRQLNRMYNLQKRDLARFHALTVNEQALQDPLNVFDYRWFFHSGFLPSFDPETPPIPIGLDMQAFRRF